MQSALNKAGDGMAAFFSQARYEPVIDDSMDVKPRRRHIQVAVDVTLLVMVVIEARSARG